MKLKVLFFLLAGAVYAPLLAQGGTPENISVDVTGGFGEYTPTSIKRISSDDLFEFDDSLMRLKGYQRLQFQGRFQFLLFSPIAEKKKIVYGLRLNPGPVVGFDESGSGPEYISLGASSKIMQRSADAFIGYRFGSDSWYLEGRAGYLLKELRYSNNRLLFSYLNDGRKQLQIFEYANENRGLFAGMEGGFLPAPDLKLIAGLEVAPTLWGKMQSNNIKVRMSEEETGNGSARSTKVDRLMGGQVHMLSRHSMVRSRLGFEKMILEDDLAIIGGIQQDYIQERFYNPTVLNLFLDQQFTQEPAGGLKATINKNDRLRDLETFTDLQIYGRNRISVEGFAYVGIKVQQ